MSSHDARAAKAGGEASGGRALPPCPYCSGRSYAPLFEDLQDRLGFVGGRWAFVRCRQCGSAVLSPFPDPARLGSFYPPVYTFGCGAEAGGSAFRRLIERVEYRLFYRPHYEAQARRILDGVGWDGRSRLRLLDVGCGRGLRLLSFQSRGIDVVGMDFQPEAVDYVGRHLGVRAVCTDFDGLGDALGDQRFDVVTAISVLEHVCDVRSVLSACSGLLEPGGWFVAMLPFVDSLQARILKSRWVAVTEAPRHVSLPSREGVRRLFADSGFEGVFLRPDSVVSCAGIFALSLLPGAATTHAYGGGGWTRRLLRGVGGVATVLSIPWCAVENHVLHRPATALVFARKRSRTKPSPQ